MTRLTVDNLFELQPQVVPITQLYDQCFDDQGVIVSVLRLDQLHPHISGNKWLKLKASLETAREQGVQQLISFGGAYSNHLHALAWAGQEFGFKTHAIVRGEPHYVHNPSLSQASSWGMTFEFISRQAYREKNNPDYLAGLQAKWGDGCLILPEGGANGLSLLGFKDLFSGRNKDHLETYDTWVLPCGTGGSLAGLLYALPYPRHVLGMPVLKNAGFLRDDVAMLLQDPELVVQPQYSKPLEHVWSLDLASHFGGYGKVKSDVTEFMARFEAQHHIELEPIYTAKMFMRTYQLIKEGYFEPGSRLLLLHTGGLQGKRGLA